MYVKTFTLEQEAEANDFIKTVVLTEGGLQVVDNKVVIFYQATKEDYQTAFVDRMIDGLTQNLFHEKVRKVTIDSEYETAKEKGTSYPNYDEVVKKAKECEQNILTFEAKIAGLVEWKAQNV